MKILLFCFAIFACLFFSSCKKNDSPTSSQVLSNSTIYGQAKFLDNSPAGFAKIEIKILGDPHSSSMQCDANGNYKFSDLKPENYIIWFTSTRNDINTIKTNVKLAENDTIKNDIIITYRILDDLSSIHINKDVFFMKFLPELGKIGNHYNLIDNLSGSYRHDVSDSSTMSADIYEIPDSLNWQNPGVDLTANYIRNHFKYLTDIVEEPVVNHNHQIKFTGEKIRTILSNPSNGFAFVKKDSSNKTLQIPCVDFQNNDFGLLINYKQ